MNILLDECLPRKLKHDLPNDQVRTVPEMGWASSKDTPLLRLAEAQFDVFITGDQNLQYQQNLRGANIAIIVLRALNNQLIRLRPLMPQVRAALPTLQSGDFVIIEESGLPRSRP